MNAAAAAIGSAAQSYSPLNTALLMVAIGFLGLIFRHQIASRKMRIEEEKSDREGWGSLIATLQNQVERLEGSLNRANERIATLEDERGRDHRLILELFGTLNRTQAAEILSSNNVSPQLRRAMESLRGQQ